MAGTSLLVSRIKCLRCLGRQWITHLPQRAGWSGGAHTPCLARGLSQWMGTVAAPPPANLKCCLLSNHSFLPGWPPSSMVRGQALLWVNACLPPPPQSPWVCTHRLHQWTLGHAAKNTFSQLVQPQLLPKGLWVALCKQSMAQALRCSEWGRGRRRQGTLD